MVDPFRWSGMDRAQLRSTGDARDDAPHLLPAPCFVGMGRAAQAPAL